MRCVYIAGCTHTAGIDGISAGEADATPMGHVPSADRDGVSTAAVPDLVVDQRGTGAEPGVWA